MHAAYLNHVDERLESFLSDYAYIVEERKWETPFGISFERRSETGWYVTYDTADAKPYVTDCFVLERKHVCPIRREDIPNLVKQFNRRSDKKGLDGMFSVYKKPRAIRSLEALFKISARLHRTEPLVWCLRVKDLFTVLCNPFNVNPERIFSSSKLNFDVRFEKRCSTRKFVSLDDLLEQLRTYNMVPISKLCNGCNLIATFTCLHKCTRCQKAHYCGKQCQKQDWAFHKTICKK